MAKTSRAMRRAGNPTVTERLNAEQQALTGAIQRAEQAVADGKRRNVLDAFRWEMTVAGVGSRPDIFRRSDDIEADVQAEVRKQILPEIDDNSPNAWRDIQKRRDEKHQFSFGHPMLQSLPDKQGFAEYDIPVTHTWLKGYDSAKGSTGKKTKKEEIVKVRVNVLKGQGFRESQGSNGESRPWGKR